MELLLLIHDIFATLENEDHPGKKDMSEPKAVSLPNSQKYVKYMKALRKQLALQMKHSNMKHRIPIDNSEILQGVINSISELIPMDNIYEEAIESNFEMHQDILKNETKEVIKKMDSGARSLGILDRAEKLENYFYEINGPAIQMIHGHRIVVHTEQMIADPRKNVMLKLSPFAIWLAHDPRDHLLDQ